MISKQLCTRWDLLIENLCVKSVYLTLYVIFANLNIPIGQPYCSWRAVNRVTCITLLSSDTTSVKKNHFISLFNRESEWEKKVVRGSYVSKPSVFKSILKDRDVRKKRWNTRLNWRSSIALIMFKITGARSYDLRLTLIGPSKSIVITLFIEFSIS